jgi:ArsR family transcriptional regulator, virulence genes transcriptional regulator
MPNPLDEIDAIQTTLLRALASPHRLRIIHLLGDRPHEVHDLAAQLALSQATVSQHLAAMRSVGLVEAMRDGRSVRYRLTDLQILTACSLMRDVIVRRLSALGSLAAAASVGTAGPAGRSALDRRPARLRARPDQVTLR